MYQYITILFQLRMFPKRNIISFQMTGTLIRMQNVVEIRKEGRRMIRRKEGRKRGKMSREKK